jgi:hypothetical protein
MNKRKQETTTEIAETYTLSHFEDPGDEFDRFYVATVRGVQFAVGSFATVEEDRAAADANLADYLTRLEPKPAYRVEEIGTVTVDTGTIVILDPCRIGRIAATQDHDNLVRFSLYPDQRLEPRDRLDENKLVRQILDPPGTCKRQPEGTQGVRDNRGECSQLEDRVRRWRVFRGC